MTVFWILAAAMAALGAAFVLVPLLRARPASGPSTAQANLDVLRAQRRELDADVAAGTLADSAREEAIAELQQRAADDVQGDDVPLVAAGKPWILAAAAGVLLPAVAFTLYFALGQPHAADPAVMAAMKGPVDDHQVTELVESLARKVRERPDDAKGWSLLARSMAALGRFQEAADAYAHLVTLGPPDASLLADYADALGMAQGRTLAGKPYQLARDALKIDPDHPKALALAGTAAMDENDFAAALGYWEHLRAGLPADSPDAPQVQSVIAEIRQRAAQAGSKLPAIASAAAAPGPARASASAPAPASTPASAGVSGSVALAPELASRVKGTETLFIFARAENGPRMPLAVVRATAKELPMRFALDDTMAMAPGMKLSAFPAVRIEARISPSGNAVPASGDLTGTSTVVKPGAREIRVVIDKAVP